MAGGAAGSHQAISSNDAPATQEDQAGPPATSSSTAQPVRRSRWMHLREIAARIITPQCDGGEVVNYSANFSCWPVMQPSVWDQRSLLFMGDSNTRYLATTMFRNSSSLGQLKCAHQGWRFVQHNCSKELGYGCSACSACCGKSECERGTRMRSRDGEISDNILGRVAEREVGFDEYHDVWGDWTAHCAHTRTRITFTWKPDIYTSSDRVAFHSRLCRERFDLIVVNKGLHDVAFDPAPTPQLHEKRAEADFARMSTLLTCTAPTPILWLAPFYSPGATRGLKLDANGTDLLRMTRNVLLRSYERGALQGNANSSIHFLDTYRMTDPTATPNAPRPYDGIHYPPIVYSWVWKLMEGLFSPRQ